MKRFFAVILALSLSFGTICSAQGLVTVEGSYTYYAPPTMNLVQAKAEALQQAKLHLIAKRFGTVVSSSTITNLSNVNGQSSSVTSTFGESEVKGEWIENIGEPEFEPGFAGDNVIITVRLKGKIREIKTSQIDLMTKLLSNKDDPRSECYDFKNGLPFYMLFKAPVKGYLAIYLSDNNMVYRLIPKRDSQDGAMEVKGGKQYLLFDGTETNKMNFTTTEDMEIDRMYVVFSPNPFTKGLDSRISDSAEAVPVQTWGDFQNWLGKCRRQDEKMTVKAFDVTIRK